MNTNDKKRKVFQSLSAFAFALTVFAANSQGGGVSAETIDLTGGMAGTSISDTNQGDGSGEVQEDGGSDEQANGDNADDIATTYNEEQADDEKDGSDVYAENNADTDSSSVKSTGYTAAQSAEGETSADNHKAVKSSSDYSQIGDNAYIVNGSNSAKNLLERLNALRDFAIYSASINTGNHIEGNVCTNYVTNFDLFNTNVAQHLTNQDGSDNYLCYVDSFENLTGDTKLGVSTGTTYDIVLGFDAECRVEGNRYVITYEENGETKTKVMEVNGDINAVTIRGLVDGEVIDISTNLRDIAADGEALRNETTFAQGGVNPFQTVSEALSNANGNSISGKDVVVINATVDQINSNDNINNGWLRNILNNNNGSNVIINVQTNGMSDVTLGSLNAQSWNSSNANVIFNFGSYNGNIKLDNWGGVIVAPNASLHNVNNIDGSVIVNTFNQGGEVHQVTGSGYNKVPSSGEQSNPDQTDHNARYQPRFPVDKRKLSRTLR